MILSLVAAVAENRAIGRGNTLPWHLGADLRRFRKLTTGHTVVMGRRTFESIGRPLPDRRNLVLSRDPGFRPEGAEAAPSLAAALELCRREAEVFVIGGAALYAAAMPLSRRLYLTRVHAVVDGDAFFPAWDPRDWQLVSHERHPADARNDHEHSFEVYERLRPTTAAAPG